MSAPKPFDLNDALGAGLDRAAMLALDTHLAASYRRTQFDPFPQVSGRYGAPMGRRGDHADYASIKRLHARRQGGGDGYDRGGAYWGTPSNVWGVWGWIDGRPVCTYVRASNRAAAIDAARGEA